MEMRKAAFSAFLLSTSLYILLPTPDELIIYPVLGFSFSYVFHFSLIYGVLMAAIIYRSTGVVCLISSFFIGGKIIYNMFKEKIRKILSNRSNND
jgi:hypothetical protein